MTNFFQVGSQATLVLTLLAQSLGHRSVPPARKEEKMSCSFSGLGTARFFFFLYPYRREKFGFLTFVSLTKKKTQETKKKKPQTKEKYKFPKNFPFNNTDVFLAKAYPNLNATCAFCLTTLEHGRLLLAIEHKSEVECFCSIH